MKMNPNAPAMPFKYSKNETQYRGVIKQEISLGLTIRQQFAMAAMQGLAAAYWKCDAKLCAEKSVEYADALITALNK